MRSVGGAPVGGAFARGYRNGQPVPPWELSEMHGTGDICATIGDLARYTTAVHSGSLLTGSSLRALRTAHTPLNGDQGSSTDWLTSDGYGYGYYVGSIAGYAAYFHPGDNPGYQSFSAWLPGPAASIVILVNDETVNLENLLKQLLPAALKT